VNFKYSRLHLNRGQSVVVPLNHQANVILVDDHNFGLYKSRKDFKHFGGHATHSPYSIPVPSTGYWTVVIDLGGFSGQVEFSINVVG
jgi:hypothetical protein